jgi:heavy metal sensor kinase
MSSKWIDRLRHALGFRLALWYAIIFVASSLVVTGLTYFLLASSLQQRDREIIENSLAEYVRTYQQGGLVALSEAIANDQAAGRREGLFVRVLGQHEQMTFLSMPGEARQFDLDQLRRPGWSTAPGRRENIVLEVASAQLADGTLVQVGKSTESREILLQRFRDVAGLVTLTVVIIALVGGTVLTRSALSPVHHLIHAVRGVTQTGRMDARVPVRQTGDAVDELSALFNQMLARIEALVEGMRGALDNVAHDLRTPMARLRGTAESALAEPRSVEEYRDALADCLEESERIVTMLNVLMDISEAETGTMRLERRPTEIAPVVHDAVDLYSDVAEEKQIAISSEVPSGLTVVGDPARLRQVVTNLLDNAIKYTSAGGRVGVGGRRAGGEVVVWVSDTGPGIGPGDLPRIWERLYRGDASRSERGLGLGLSLVRAVVQAHGGRVAVESDPGHGSTFQVFLPAADSISPITPM